MQIDQEDKTKETKQKVAPKENTAVQIEEPCQPPQVESKPVEECPPDVKPEENVCLDIAAVSFGLSISGH